MGAGNAVTMSVVVPQRKFNINWNGQIQVINGT